MDSRPRVVLELDSTEIPVYGEQERGTYNGYFESTSYRPLLLFNGAKPRSCNAHGAEDWGELLLRDCILCEQERRRYSGCRF